MLYSIRIYSTEWDERIIIYNEGEGTEQQGTMIHEV
jgi:hypothetical protein